MKETYLQRAIDLSIENVKNNQGGPFGCVIVYKNAIIAEGVNQVTTNCDPTAHAEIQAIRAAAKKLGIFNLSDCQLYTSCEPCPMCLSAIYWAHIPTVYCACTKEQAADAGFIDDDIYKELQLPMQERRIDFQQLTLPDSNQAFKLWDISDQKTKY